MGCATGAYSTAPFSRWAAQMKEWRESCIDLVTRAAKVFVDLRERLGTSS